MSDKTEEPTPQKLQKARKEGDVPVSSALVQSGAMIVAISLLPVAALSGYDQITMLMNRAVTGHRLSPQLLPYTVMMVALPMLAGAASGAFLVGYIQTGGLITGGKLKLKLDNLNPVKGIKNLFKMDRIFQIMRSFITVLFVSYLCMNLMRDNTKSIVAIVGDTGAAMGLAGLLGKKLLWISFVAGLILACVDIVMVRRSWKKRNKMSKDDVKREHKDSEGDPQLKGQRKQAAEEMLNSASINSVKDANVVIVNPTHLASALRYRDDEDTAPTLVAQGEGELAKKIVAAARAYGVPIVRDVPVARALRELEVGDEIPEVLYEAVAEILREVWEEEEGESAEEELVEPPGQLA